MVTKREDTWKGQRNVSSIIHLRKAIRMKCRRENRRNSNKKPRVSLEISGTPQKFFNEVPVLVNTEKR
jgi:hypothetical protein